jgi:small nuclear ribonucleoprotein (snRNP)-like protein
LVCANKKLLLKSNPVENDLNEDLNDIKEINLNIAEVAKEGECVSGKVKSPENIPKLHLDNNVENNDNKNYNKQLLSKSMSERLPDN